MKVTQADISGAMRAEREELVAYLEGVPDGAWDKATLCEGWRVRDVVAHLVGNAADIVAQRLEGAGSVEYNQRQIDERADSSPTELLTEWSEQGPALEQAMAAVPQEMWDSPYPPFGTVGQALQRLLEDIWVHAQDIRLPLGDGTTSGPGLDATLDVLEREIPERFGRLAPGVGEVVIETDGVTRTATVGEGETLKVRGKAVDVALMATGRVSLDEAVADGRLEIEPAPPQGFADAFNVYGP